MDLPQYYLEISPWHPQMAEVRVIQRATLQYNADYWTAYCRADEQSSQALLALFGLTFEDWDGTFASHFLEESAMEAAGAAVEAAEAIR